MKFLKASVVIFFFLSLFSCFLTLFLSTVRENEKQKRIQLEQVRTQLEQHVSTLESEKAEANRQVTDLTAKLQSLEEQLQKEQAGRAKTTALLHEKEEEVKSVRSEMAEVDKAFANAQKRNRQLEQILDELETRVKEMEEAQKTAPPPPEVGYVQLDVTPHTSTAVPSSVQTAPAPPVSIQAVKVVPEEVSVKPEPPKPVAEKPKKKKKGLFSFLKRGKKKESTEDVPPGWKESATPAAVSNQVSAPTVPPKLDTAQMKPVSVPVSKTESPEREAKPAPVKREGVASGGKVLLVNRKFNFVVVDLGSKQGLQLDDMLVIEKNGSAIGKARVEKLYDDYCAAYLTEEQSETPAAEGDLIRPA